MSQNLKKQLKRVNILMEKNNNEKLCKKCDQVRNADTDFYKNGSKTHYWCKKCMNFYSGCWYREMKKRILEKKNNQIKNYKVVKVDFSEDQG
jgi:hypothetical protein